MECDERFCTGAGAIKSSIERSFKSGDRLEKAAEILFLGGKIRGVILKDATKVEIDRAKSDIGHLRIFQGIGGFKMLR